MHFDMKYILISFSYFWRTEELSVTQHLNVSLLCVMPGGQNESKNGLAFFFFFLRRSYKCKSFYY